ncbi:MAG: acyl-CoA reductase, partial [Polyangiaceae bacterium]
REGVLLGFECLEREADDADLHALLARAGAAHHVHVILSANVFVAPLRALALACAASPSVTVRPSPRDPTLAHALVEALAEDSVAVVEVRDVASVTAGEIHVYGRDATIAAVRDRVRPGVVVRGHGPGIGVAVVTRAADLRQAANALARDVVLFDQRGCLSPRLAFVEGDDRRGEAFATAMHDELTDWDSHAPRGVLSFEERAQVAAWQDTLTFAGRLFPGTGHLVGLLPHGAPVSWPPVGRHLAVWTAPKIEAFVHAIAPTAPFVVTVGSDDPDRARAVAPIHARMTRLGRMQRPPLDGPVDRRNEGQLGRSGAI